MDDKGRHCKQIACLRLVAATGQHRVSGCCRSTRVNDARDKKESEGWVLPKNGEKKREEKYLRPVGVPGIQYFRGMRGGEACETLLYVFEELRDRRMTSDLLCLRPEPKGSSASVTHDPLAKFR
jgi:hypothetical protein